MRQQVGLSAKLRARSSRPAAAQDCVSSQSPETRHLHKPEQLQEETPRQILATASAAEICVSQRSDTNSTRAPSSVCSVSSAPGWREFCSLSFSSAGGKVKHQERARNQRPGAATAVSLFGATQLLFCPSPFHSRLLCPPERFSGVVACPWDTFHTPFVAAAGTDLTDSQTVSWVPHQSPAEVSAPVCPSSCSGQRSLTRPNRNDLG